MDTFFRTRLGGFVLIALLLMLWEVAARTGAVSPQAFPPFSRVMQSLWNLIVTGKIVGILLPSLERMAWGYVFALVLGMAGGIVDGIFFRGLSPV